MARRRKRRNTGRWLLALAAGVALFGLGLLLGQGRWPARPELPWSKGERAAGAPARSAAAPKPAAAARSRPAAPAEPPAEPAARLVAAPGPAPVARIAVLIDDLGARLGDAERLLAIGVPLSFAVLPYEPETKAVAALVAARGGELLCHLPMAPEGSEDPGPGALTEGMSAGEVARRTRAAIEAVPGAVGVNNHMGSRLTAEAPTMRAVLGVVAERGLFFVDSRTTPDSVAEQIARELGLPTAARDVFLDAGVDAPSIGAELDRLLALARERGAAIAIAHPHRATLELLERELPRLKARGFELVPVSYLLEREETLPE